MKVLLFLFKFFVKLFILGAACTVIGFTGAYLYLTPKLDAVDELKSVQYQVPLRIYTSDHKLIAQYGEKKRIPLEYHAFPPTLVQAFISAEDDRFFHHPGVDYKGLLRAVITLARTGERRQGGSTITMQVARNFFLSRKKTYLRKLNEIFLSLKIERELSKQDILALYLNKIFLGYRSYGVAAASQVYYGKPLSELTLAQHAMIGGLPKAPSAYNPIANPKRAKTRRNYVLKRMLELGYITQEEHDTSAAEPVTAKIHGQKIEAYAPYISEMVRAFMVEKYGDDAMVGGFQVYTTVKTDLQYAARAALRKALIDYEMRHGYRGIEKHFDVELEIENTDLLDKHLSNIPTVGNLKPGIVTAVEDKQAHVYLKGGENVILTWAGMSWAKKSRYANKPKTASQLMVVGDLIRLRDIPNPQLKKSKKKNKKTPEELALLPKTIWALTQVPAVGGAIVSLDPLNGAVQSLVGGFDFYHSKFNRVMQAKRQPGSGFKPFVYTAALDSGYTAATLINDAPITHKSGEEVWRPENYGHKTYGPTRLRVGLRKSRNLISIRLLRDIGIDYARNFVTRFGFPLERIPKNLSLVLGTGTFTPMEMATAYMSMANGGYKLDHYLIEQITDGRGKRIFHHQPLVVCPKEGCEPVPITKTIQANLNEASDITPGETKIAAETVQPNAAPRIISRQVHYVIQSILQDVIQSGTGIRAKRELKRRDIAGKTGTTNDQKDAWFYGYNRKYVTVAWVGYDNVTPLGSGETGGKAALPMWIEYMKVALKNVPQKQFPQPSGIVSVRIDSNTGQLTNAKNPNSLFEIFRADLAPKKMTEPDIQPDGSHIPEIF
jgi:penicillin-binding protein 1A